MVMPIKGKGNRYPLSPRLSRQKSLSLSHLFELPDGHLKSMAVCCGQFIAQIEQAF